jgi:4-amino-4-deoxy-L-arabinose transferase-like glycosyltransferase
VNTPTPALVTERGARRLPRVPLLLLCAAYVLPGLFGRDPWRSADLVAFGQMAAIAEGRTAWWAPMLGGVPTDSALLPHWLGAVAILVLGPWLGDALAARVPFALLLASVLAGVWYTTFHLARTEAAQPAPFAFGGEAAPVDYARAIADGALLALMACLGLLQLGHETTPELMQLAAVAWALYAFGAAPFRHWRSRLVVLLALPLLAGAGAPTVALLIGAAGFGICLASQYPQVRRFAPWVVAATLLSALAGTALGGWRLRLDGPGAAELIQIARQWLWFLWPAWLLALWTVWRWRAHWSHRHISLPGSVAAIALAANLAMGGQDRALMLGLPAFAVLAAFALPTLKRSTTAAIDWFSMFFFTLAALLIWTLYVAQHTGVPAKPAANIARLIPGHLPEFNLAALLLAMLASVAWVALVRWRTSRQREALWKSLVLPAGGVALCWLLLMTLWLPPLDHARSPRVWVQRVQATLPPGQTVPACVAAPGLAAAPVAALEHFARWKVDAATPLANVLAAPACPVLIRQTRQRQPLTAPAGWQLVGQAMRPADRDEITWVFVRR